jgi:hypothetical protein
MRYLKIIFLFTLPAALFSLNGCRKDTPGADDFTSTAEDIGQAEMISADLDNMTSQVTRMSSFTPENTPDPSYDHFGFSSCAVVTNDSINHILTLDFGNGCMGHDGRTRSGRVVIASNGTGYFDPGSSWTITFDNFYVNGRHVEGIRSVTNNGLNNAGNMTWTIDAQNMKITRPDGSWRSWNSVRTREMTAGYGDSTWTNDIYVINGTLTGTNSQGESINSVLTGITRDHACHFITSGTMTVTPASRPTRTIDFGNGTCDDLATVTRNGMTRTIHLRF